MNDFIGPPVGQGHPSFIGPPEAGAAGAAGAPGQGMGAVGIGMMVGGAINSALSAYYSVQASQYKARSQAMSLDFQSSLANINARNAEQDAQQALRSGRFEIGKVGLQYGQVKATAEARQAAAGIQSGVGSAAEIIASIDLAKEVDQLAITRNSVRAANAARTGRQGALIQGRMAGVSANNLRRSASGMSRSAAGGISLLGSSGQVARSWYEFKRTQ